MKRIESFVDNLTEIKSNHPLINTFLYTYKGHEMRAVFDRQESDMGYIKAVIFVTKGSREYMQEAKVLKEMIDDIGTEIVIEDLSESTLSSMRQNKLFFNQ